MQITLNRPSARNALSTALIERLLDQLSSLSEDHELRALLITGAGDLAFSSGADLHERREMNSEQKRDHTESINTLADAIALFPVPVCIAAIRGYALAGGIEIAVACDIRVAGTDAIFGLPEVKIGIFPGAGGLVRLPRLIGPSNARELIYTGRQVPAREAFEFGLVDHLVAPEQVLPQARKLAEEIAANAPLAIRAAKRACGKAKACQSVPLTGSSSNTVARSIIPAITSKASPPSPNAANRPFRDVRCEESAAHARQVRRTQPNAGLS